MSTRTRFTCLLLSLWVCPALAHVLGTPLNYYPDRFYSETENGTHDKDLVKLLHEILSKAHVTTAGHDQLVDQCTGSSETCYQHLNLGYTLARQIMFGELHLVRSAEGYSVKDVYCDHIANEREFARHPPGPGMIPDAEILNTEHTWPQSRFSRRFDRMLQKSDLHILYPVLSNANSSRSNHEFNNVQVSLSSPCPHAHRGYDSTGSSRMYFEVPDAHKGNVARAIFYFSVRYLLKVSPEEENSLKAWHHQDPPDAFEIERNEKIFAKQKVRNPFIDHPGLVDLISDF